jgi:hypothetical protein
MKAGELYKIVKNPFGFCVYVYHILLLFNKLKMNDPVSQLSVVLTLSV